MTAIARSRDRAEAAGRTLYDRDHFGTAFAIEILEAPGWHGDFSTPPARHFADVRVVNLAPGAPREPCYAPAWLAACRGDVEQPPAVRALWLRSPYYRAPPLRPTSEYVASGSLALSYPSPPRTHAWKRVQAFLGDSSKPELLVGSVAEGLALERWLQASFRDPDDFWESLVIERIERTEGAELIEPVRFLRDADIPESELATIEQVRNDRIVFLDIARPSLYFEDPGRFRRILPAVQSWRERYQAAYASFYRSVLADTEHALLWLSALYDDATGPPDSSRRARRRVTIQMVLREIEALPAEPDYDAPMTNGLALGQRPFWVDRARIPLAVEHARTYSRSRPPLDRGVLAVVDGLSRAPVHAGGSSPRSSAIRSADERERGTGAPGSGRH